VSANWKAECEHPLYEEIKNNSGKTISLKCRFCTYTVAFGTCDQCGKRASKLPAKAMGHLFCGVDCMRAWLLGRARQARAAKKAAAALPSKSPTLPGVEMGEGDVMAKARGR
jgi:hypothetical protein